ncbi:hypothetical protein [Bacillus alkalicellulosilyticus]|nr:hypothetical protein [Bacillus alkalicellulosilyticus]
MTRDTNEDTGHRGESYKVKGMDARKTPLEASYEYASGNKVNKKKNK